MVFYATVKFTFGAAVAKKHKNELFYSLENKISGVHNVLFRFFTKKNSHKP